MSLNDILLLVLAGFAAGGMNALAGGGTFFSFPALLAAGLPPVTANATNAVALWPASLAAAWAARSSLRPLGRYLLPLLLAGLCGGLGGGLLLLAGGDEIFRHLIPWLLLAATALFAASPWLSRLLAARRAQAAPSAQPPHSPLSLGAHVGVSIYGGYFGAGMGILQLAAFSIEGHPVARANALKNLISAVIYSIATVTFVVAGRVSWYELAILLTGATLGGYAGGALGQRLPPALLRSLVIGVGGGMTTYYFWATYFAA
ncbi:sulfite exporter TauE/SafE family protein [Pseudomonas benzenivorans]|uniref:Probable membrane transporter protein n=1 Tax=Pseudomonas benzenivorans TaxID=556533 RepID=A0ABY5H2L1_9PSED|nr:sulfite exporter TauE/SafE family protein [Pseudomonas benzenivorans]UTW06523.1 sulfite exporter TauE/SafE family protein [Pseudomonas benzenivorans]